MHLSSRISALMSLAAVALGAVALAACGGGSSTSSKSAKTSGDTATVDVATSSLGNILVDSQGRTLYLFKKDSGAKSACFGPCATSWPPLRASGRATVGPGVSDSSVASVARSDGGPQV